MKHFCLFPFHWSNAGKPLFYKEKKKQQTLICVLNDWKAEKAPIGAYFLQMSVVTGTTTRLSSQQLWIQPHELPTTFVLWRLETRLRSWRQWDSGNKNPLNLFGSNSNFSLRQHKPFIPEMVKIFFFRFVTRWPCLFERWWTCSFRAASPGLRWTLSVFSIASPRPSSCVYKLQAFYWWKWSIFCSLFI